MSKPQPYAAKLFIPLPPEEEIRRVLGDTYKPSVLNVTKMLTGTGECFPAVVSLVKALFHADAIEPKLREVITLRVASLLNAPYEWQQNARMALNTGLTQEEIDAVAADGPPPGLSPEYSLGCAAVDELLRQGTLADATLSALLARYGDVGARKLILAIGYFVLLAMFLNGCRVPLETTDKIGSSVSPLS